MPSSAPPALRDETRWVVPLFALAAAIVAVVADPGPAGATALAAVPVAAFAAWALMPRLPLALLSVLVLVPVVLAQRDGSLEPLMFEASVLAFVVGRWARSLREAAALGVLTLGAPLAAAWLQDPDEIGGLGVWLLGIAFPWLISRAVARQAELSALLDASRRELAEQALLAERRRIARDVHDTVGHGLAAMMLQVTSARHVLRRDPAAAEEALAAAEDVGRRSMGELRRTVGLLRSDEDDTTPGALPSAREIPALVDQARAAGLAVELRVSGDLSRLGGGADVAAYRIAQEALANAARHAPGARTVLALEVDGASLGLSAVTSGPLAAPAAADGERPRYGLIGMRERAASLGGTFEAGPADGGWRVRCRLPIAPDGEAGA